MAKNQLPEPLRTIYGADPLAFVAGFLKDFKNALIDVQNRAVYRSGLTTVNVDDINPNKAGKQRGKMSLTARPNDRPEELGMRMVSLIMAGKGGLLADEAQRKARGLPRGPKSSKGFDADGFEIEIDEVMGDDELAAIPPSTLHRSIFGIDDAIIIGIGVPILIAVLPSLIGWLAEAASGIFSPEGTAPPPVTNPDGSITITAPDGTVTTTPPAGGDGLLDGTVELPGLGAIDKKLALAGAVVVGLIVWRVLR